MADADSPDSPLEAAAGAASPRAIEAFSVLGNETRLSILLALWEAFETWREDNAVPFSELRERLGNPDPGQFNYHLNKLAGHFIRKTDDGYVLRHAGHQLVRTVIAGTGIEEPSIEPTEIESACIFCNSPIEVALTGGEFHLACTECEGQLDYQSLAVDEDTPSGLLVIGNFDPAGLTDRTPEQIWKAKLVELRKVALSFIEGVCPTCSGPTEFSLDICENHISDGVCGNCGRRFRVWARFHCTICKRPNGYPPYWLFALHPRVIAFYSERGVPLQFDDSGPERKAGGLVGEYDQKLVSEDPPRVRFSYQYDGDRFEVLVDEEMNVLEVTEPD